MAAPGRRWVAAAAGVASLALVAGAGLAGPQDGSRNPANYLAWLYFWPGVAILVALAGDVWRHVDPWRLAAMARSEAAGEPPAPGVWPAVAAFAGFAWFDLASGLASRPRDLAVAILVFSAFVLVPVLRLGPRWAAAAEPFGLVMAGIGRGSLRSLLRPSAPPAEDRGGGWDRFALHLLPVSAAIFDALIAAPQWTALAGAIGGAPGLERGHVLFVAIRTAGLALTCAAVAGLLLAAAATAGSRWRLPAMANRLALVTLPAAVTLMAAHNLPALLQLGPRLPVVLAALATGAAAGPAISPETPVAVTAASPIWAAEVALLALGLVWSGWLAWRDLGPAGRRPADRVATAYPAWVTLTVTSAAALLILYQPVAALTAG